MITLEKAKEICKQTITEKSLIAHSTSVMAAMGAMAKFYNEDEDYWMAIGYLHDYDYEQYPSEHLQHTEKPLLEMGIDEEDVRAILSHGYGICTDVEPITLLEKSLYTVDELTGIICACAKMRPNGIQDLETSSFMKKFKDKKFAAKCDREIILKGCAMLNLEIKEVAQICIEGMRPYAAELELLGTGQM